MRSSRSAKLPSDLLARISDCGYFPELVADSIAMALGDEEVRAHLVHLEATFNSDEVHRHVSVFVLTPTRLLVGHTDDATEGLEGGAEAITSTESVPLQQVKSVTLTRVLAKPEAHGRGSGARGSQVIETWLSLGWGTMRRIDVEPAHCPDPTCEADHGFTGSLVGDDITVRMSPAADGVANVEGLVSFGTALQLATGGR